jgi:RNA recognition motif-containing protein
MNACCHDRSRILLVCIGLDVYCSHLNQLNTRVLFSIFRPFGPLKKIVLFSRSPIVKAFVEFADPEAAALAVEFAHEAFVDNWGRTRLYYSTLSELKFTNRFIDSLDCSHLDIQSLDDLLLSRNFEDTEQMKRCSDNEPLGERTSLFFQSDSKQNMMDIETQQATPIDQRHSFNDPDIRPRSILGTNSSFNFTGSKARPSPLPRMPSFGQLDSQRSFAELEISPSKVILFSNIDPIFASASEIYNLFSCFGNIRKVLFMKNIRKAMVEFSTVEYAQSCLLYLNNRPFGSSKIKVNFSKYKKIDLKKNNKTENSQNFNEVVIVLPEMDRYSANHLSVVTPPSGNVVVGYPKKQAAQVSDLRLMVQAIRHPQSWSLLEPEISFNEVQSGLRVLFKFATIAEAMLVIAKLHNTVMHRELVDVSFA